MMICKAELQSIIHEETAFALFRVRRKYFESGDKAGKMLALRLKPLRNRHSISNTCKSTGEVIYEQTHIYTAFREYYSKMYQRFHRRERDGIFLSLYLPFNFKRRGERKFRGSPYRKEIFSALKAFPSGKAPGNDGFTIELYKCLQHNLSPLLTLLFNNILTNHSMPPTMCQAAILLLPKPGKDHSQMTNFRPKSMLNNDYKLFAKILAMPMETAISSLIHLDQVRFIKG